MQKWLKQAGFLCRVDVSIIMPGDEFWYTPVKLCVISYRDKRLGGWEGGRGGAKHVGQLTSY